MTWKTTYQTWLDKDNLDPELKASLHNYSEEEAKEAFYQPLEFGTAGMRGIMGPGINRMNIYTVRQATKGLADDLVDQGFVKAAAGVVIAYDSRHRSRLFAEEAARVLGHENIKVYLFKDLRPTPLLSFAVRHFEAAAGLMITASHNPPAYNGYKVYNSQGGQILDDEAASLTQHVRAVSDPLDVQVADLKKMEEDGLLHWVGPELDEVYLDHLEGVVCDSPLIEDKGQDLNLVFTPLHGTGQTLALDALERAGFKNVHVVEAQIEGDGDFPTVESPNPEDPQAFQMAQEKGKQVGADLLIATDPDADRMGLGILHGGDYVYLSGNQIAALMMAYLLKTYKDQARLPADGIVLKSIVSSSLPFEIAEAYGMATENTLTGFKYIADRIEAYETTGEKSFLFGFEESYGYLIQPFARDKDAIQATLVAAEMALAAKVKGQTLVDVMEDIYERYGYFEEKTISLTFEGIDGQEKMLGILEGLRATSPSHWASIPVLVSEDYLTGERLKGDGQVEKLSLPTSNLLRYLLEDGSWIALRPSGTEPKLKLYVGAKAQTASLAKEKVADFEDALLALGQ